MNSKGKAKKFIKLVKNGKIRWSNKESDIINVNKFIECIFLNFLDPLNEIIGFLYGKRSKTLRKESN